MSTDPDTPPVTDCVWLDVVGPAAAAVESTARAAAKMKFAFMTIPFLKDDWQERRLNPSSLMASLGFSLHFAT
ncbi:hypothetical protein WS70_22625 [Burkholderia mayonis]|uniref:Uncharacterized protein n=1 Tax=Burkholderia mayonis TaxID=1385591 RepID=A0A1B4FLP7_9BURK|nr:hypothetical protein WS70_22625 [Burkholderia mayonis]KVE34600.1 hypothetical protein WS69_17035 [Burkholderia sp. BDU5]KVE44629.1 hypothetical protein WS70_06400 [Burkholderia mayonis]